MEAAWIQSLEVLEVTDSDKTLVVLSCGCRSLEELTHSLNSAICLAKLSSRLPGPLLSVQVTIVRSKSLCFEVEWIIGKFGDTKVEITLEADLNTQADKPEVFRRRKKRVEKYEARRDVAEPVVTLDQGIREALRQVKVESRYTCKLLSLEVTKELKVDLVMEELERSLFLDFQQRRAQGLVYSEAELISILDNISDALLFAKFQVSCT